jgi:hypothetical protein
MKQQSQVISGDIRPKVVWLGRETIKEEKKSEKMSFEFVEKDRRRKRTYICTLRYLVKK